MSDSKWVQHASDATFESQVLERSNRELVVLDFWAEWCGPCRALGPVLEKLASQYAGKFTLVKANTDEAPEAAGRYGVASIPTVLAIADGEVVDAFEGAVPEPMIRQWLDKLIAAADLKATEKLEQDDPAAAEQRLRKMIEADPRDREVATRLAELLWQQQRVDECRQILGALEREAPLESAAARIKASLELQQKSTLDLDAARRAAQAEPNNFPLQLKLAEALLGHRQYQEGFEICLDLVSRDRKQTGEQARALMVEVFRALPDDSPLTSEYRRKLATALY